MRLQTKNILITRPLSGQQREYARILGLNPIERPALEFEFPKYWDEVLGVINDHRRSAWVFTSANAVKALEKLMEAGMPVRPEVQVFAVGAKTQEALKELGVDAKIPFQQDGAHLAELIIDEGNVDSVIHFHGNLSRDEMKNALEAKEIETIKVEVYKTHIRTVNLPAERVEAVLFYSPSAVEAFKNGQGFEESLPPLFAIGLTTADALKKEIDQPVHIAEKPDTKLMLQAVSAYLFQKQKMDSE